MRKYVILALILALTLGIILGLYLFRLDKINEKIAFEVEYKKLEKENIVSKEENITEETNSVEKKTSPSTIIIEKKYYNDCGHLVVNDKKIEENLINKNIEEIQIEYIGWEIQKFTQNEVVVYKEINDFCNEHYLLKDEKGIVSIYQLDKNDQIKKLVRKTDIQSKYLTDEDIKSLEDGIKVFGNMELSQILQDFE